MRIEVQLFAGLRELVGAEKLVIAAHSGITFAELRLLIVEKYPRMHPLLKASRFAAGNGMVADERLVDSTERIALIPPVSGG